MLACAFQQLPFLSIQKPGLTYVREDHAVVQAVKRRKKATINEQIGNEVVEVSLSEEHIIFDSFWQRRKTGVQRTLGGNVSRARSTQHPWILSTCASMRQLTRSRKIWQDLS